MDKNYELSWDVKNEKSELLLYKYCNINESTPAVWTIDKQIKDYSKIYLNISVGLMFNGEQVGLYDKYPNVYIQENAIVNEEPILKYYDGSEEKIWINTVDYKYIDQLDYPIFQLPLKISGTYLTWHSLGWNTSEINESIEQAKKHEFKMPIDVTEAIKQSNSLEAYYNVDVTAKAKISRSHPELAEHHYLWSDIPASDWSDATINAKCKVTMQWTADGKIVVSMSEVGPVTNGLAWSFTSLITMTGVPAA